MSLSSSRGLAPPQNLKMAHHISLVTELLPRQSLESEHQTSCHLQFREKYVKVQFKLVVFAIVSGHQYICCLELDGH